MKKVFVAIALTTFVGSMATTAYAAVNGTQIVKKDDDKRKKKKKSSSCCSANGQQKSCSSSSTSTQKSCSGEKH
jgi:hypothetical protein